MRKHIVLSIGILLLIFPTATQARTPQLSLAGVLSAAEGDFDAPAAWSGIWMQEIAIYDCDSGLLLFSTTSTDTICPGDPLYITDSGATVTCSGTATDTDFNLECGWTAEEPPGCIEASNVIFVGTRSGETFEMTATINSTFTGETCEFTGDLCLRTEISGTRIGPAPPTCGTPVEAATWGEVKALFR